MSPCGFDVHTIDVIYFSLLAAPAVDALAGTLARLLEAGSASRGASRDGRLESVTDQAALFTEMRRFLASLATTGPTVVLLEDLHWADPASMELLRHVAPLLEQWPLLLLATYRADELTRQHPFYRLLPSLVREADGLRIDLRRLDHEGLRALVAARYAFAPADERRLVEYLQRHAEGNPFFATELLRALEEEGASTAPAIAGRWQSSTGSSCLPCFGR